jgi:hypothetical protein
MRRLFTFVAALALLLVLAAPALAVAGSGGAGEEFGQHHADHAQQMTGFTGDTNPGVHHQGFSGWPGHTE